MTVRFAREPLTDALWAEAFPLLREHWREVAAFPDIPLEPDRERYAVLEANGALACFTAREAHDGMWTMHHSDKTGEHSTTPLSPPLVGYALYVVAPNLHYSSSLQAVQDVIYLDPSMRGTGVGYRFIKYCDEQLTTMGVQVVMQHLKAKLDAKMGFSRLLERQGYELTDLVYAKRLDKPEWKYIARIESIDQAKLTAPAEPKQLVYADGRLVEV